MIMSPKRPCDPDDEFPNKKTAPEFHTYPLSLEHRRTNDEIHSSCQLSPLTTLLLDTLPLQRLRHLKQLGTADYVYVNANHSRLEHSLGVSHLAAKLCLSLKLKQPALQCTDKDVACVELAGLFHDVGHGPFSHIYEVFLSLLDIQFHHETMSIELLKLSLKQRGLAINLSALDEPLQQVGSGVDARTLVVNDSLLTSRDFVFIQECIHGKPVPTIEAVLGPGFHGRAPKKEWMYDIVANRHSGLDVDKIDYYARDGRRALRESGEIDKVMVEDAVVAWVRDCRQCGRGHLMICYPEKTIPACLGFFKKRFELHTKVYKHKTTAAVSYMICDIFRLADPYFRLTALDTGLSNEGKRPPGHDSWRISQAMVDPAVYLRLRDSIIDLIANTTDPDLHEARDLIQRLWRRDLYKCAAIVRINSNDPMERQLWMQSEATMLQGMMAVGGEHTGNLTLSPNDVIVEKCCIHHGSQEENPLAKMRFLEKSQLSQLQAADINDLPVAKAIKESDYEAHLPRSFQENSIRVYSRDSAKTDLVRHVFSTWMHELTGEMELTGMNGSAPAMLSQDSYEEDTLSFGDYDSEDGGLRPESHFVSRGKKSVTPPRRRMQL